MKYTKATAEIIVFDHKEFMTKSKTGSDSYFYHYCHDVEKKSDGHFWCNDYGRQNLYSSNMDFDHHREGFDCSTF